MTHNKKYTKRNHLINDCYRSIIKCGIKEEYKDLYNKSKLVKYLYDIFPKEMSQNRIDAYSANKIHKHIYSLEL
jgi:hypothetical protein